MRVQITLGDDYAALKALADEQDRTVAGQARHMLRRALKNSQGEARAHEINAALEVPVTSLTARQAELAKDYVATAPPVGGLSMDDITLNALPSLREDADPPQAEGLPLDALRDPQSVRPDASPDSKHEIKSPEAVAHVAKEPLPG